MTEKQGCGDEGETKGKRREARKDPEMGVHGMKGRSRGDPGKIHRSKGFGVQGCQRKYRKRQGGKVLVQEARYEDKGGEVKEMGARMRQGQ